MQTTELELTTGTRRMTDITGEVAAFVREHGGDGLVSVFLPHATAGVALFETGAGSEEDLSSLLEDLVPRDDRWRHRHGSPGHGADHLIPALVSPSVTIPFADGSLLLGTWQSIVLVDFNRDNHERRVRLSLLRG